MPNKTYPFTFTGWKALVALAIIGGWYGLRVYMNVQPVSDDQRQVIEEFLTREYSGNSPQDLLRRLQAANTGQPIEGAAASPLHVNLHSAAARGAYNHVIIRVEVSVDGGHSSRRSYSSLSQPLPPGRHVGRPVEFRLVPIFPRTVVKSLTATGFEELLGSWNWDGFLINRPRL